MSSADGASAGSSRVAVGEQITVGFDASALHWFDPQTTLHLP